MNPDHSTRPSLSATVLLTICLALTACGSSAGSDAAGADSSTTSNKVTSTEVKSTSTADDGSSTPTDSGEPSTADPDIDAVDTSGTLCQALKGYSAAMGTILSKSGGMATGNAEATASIKALERKVAPVVAAEIQDDFHTSMAYYYENQTAEKTPAQLQAETNLTNWLQANCKPSDLGG